MTDFFISYTRVDKPWAEWVAWALEEEGYTVVVEAWDIRPGANFMVAMDEAVREAKRVIAILTEDYGKSVYGKTEWAAVLAKDPVGQQGKLVPVRVAPCEPQGLLRAISWIDLVGLDEGRAREQLLNGLRNQRMKPDRPPLFPGAPLHRSAPHHPAFPASPAAPPKAVQLARWREYSREQIPPLFDLEFSEALWNVGFVAFAEQKQIFLLVTLEKRSMEERHQYEDQFLSPHLFQWQSQNRTSQDGKHGRRLKGHVAERVHVHLFVREQKKLRTGKSAPFIYCGPVRFQSWKGDQPITVFWELDEPVPEPLRERLRVLRVNS